MTWLTTLLPGLLVGIALERLGFADLHTVRRTFALRTPVTRALAAALGFGMLLCALLCWLAVIDTDLLPVLPLDGGVVLGGVIAGVALGLTGCTPGTCLAALGGGCFLPALCGILGIVSGAALFMLAGSSLSFADALLPESTVTLFRVTLTLPYAVDGRFLGLGCLGLFIVAVTLLFPHSTPERKPSAPAPAEPTPPPSTAPAVVQEEAFISLLPEEEPLVVDTVAADDAQAANPPPQADTASDAPLAAEDVLTNAEENILTDTPPIGPVTDTAPTRADSTSISSTPGSDGAADSIAPSAPVVSDTSSPDYSDHKEDSSMNDLRPADPVTPGMTPAPASADPETGVSPVPVVLPARKVHKRKPTGTRKPKD